MANKASSVLLYLVGLPRHPNMLCITVYPHHQPSAQRPKTVSHYFSLSVYFHTLSTQKAK